MADDQRTGRVFGALFIITFLTSIPAALLFAPVLQDPAGYLAGGGSDTQIHVAAFLEFLLIISNVGTAVVLYRIAMRRYPTLAIAFVAARIMESVFIASGVMFVLAIVALRHEAPEAVDVGVSLAALKDLSFLFGPGLVVPIGNGLILGYLMYRSGLVPRRMAWFGLIGGPLLLIGQLGVLFDVWDAGSAARLLVVPEAIWELFVGFYCALRGFRRDSPILTGEP